MAARSELLSILSGRPALHGAAALSHPRERPGWCAAEPHCTVPLVARSASLTWGFLACLQRNGVGEGLVQFSSRAHEGFVIT